MRCVCTLICTVESHEAFSIRLESSIASVSQEGPDAMKIDICVRSQIDEVS